ncbi:hypothetical protein QMA09_09575 [Planococcus sp. APC 3906]|uniref:hypothetical protein n=1 Tax=Planococcus sp. APC 3906 TaxID=3035194 RepID=UPI0025B48D73|nr:hypothetical protein [Planococcus sp. APC 3906]MDN3450442.1 hypothetical protein [Planococcus sp. APC 3906]
MDFKSRIIEAVTSAEKEIKRVVDGHELTIKRQKEEIEELRQYASQAEEIERLQKEVQELRKQLRVSEGENLLLQVRLDLEAAKEKKKTSSELVTLTAKENPPTKISQETVDKRDTEDEWEDTLLQVRRDLEAANEKKQREKTYYENSSSTGSFAATDLSAISGSVKPAIYRYKVNVIDGTSLETFIRKYNLVERDAILPLYETKNSREIYLYTEVETIFIDLLLKEIYMVKDEFDKLQARYSPLVLKHRQLTAIKHPVREKQSADTAGIQWGSIDAKPSFLKDPIEDSLFSEQSELNKMGYRISGITREERWEVLRRAIPALGLKKVVNIISANVRLRKRQKNGEQKYQYAIAEWEYDLSQLKKKYYYDGFKWPES